MNQKKTKTGKRKTSSSKGPRKKAARAAGPKAHSAISTVKAKLRRVVATAVEGAMDGAAKILGTKKERA